MSGTKRFPLRVVAVATLALVPVLAAVAVLQGSLAKRDATRQEPLAASLEICYDNANNRLDVGCAVTIVDSRTGTDPVEDATEVLELSRTDERYAVGCHSILHAIGQKVARTADFTARADTLRSLWEPCGYGMLHGVFEKIALPTEQAAASVILREACDVGGIRTEVVLHGECLHALGHAVYDHFGQGDEGYEVCSAAFPGKETRMTTGRTGCYSGLAMKSRDVLLQRILDGVATVQPSVEGFANAGRVCARADDPEWVRACAPGFVQIATEYGASHMKHFLQWCTETLGPPARECYQQAGVYMGHFNTKFDSFEQIMTICGENEGTVGTDPVDLCRASTAQGLKNIGEQPGVAVDRVCQVLVTFPRGTDTCRLARETAI